VQKDAATTAVVDSKVYFTGCLGEKLFSGTRSEEIWRVLFPKVTQQSLDQGPLFFVSSRGKVQDHEQISKSYIAVCRFVGGWHVNGLWFQLWGQHADRHYDRPHQSEHCRGSNPVIHGNRAL
jgi:hypothetical protein